jgi:hypothetical protein
LFADTATPTLTRERLAAQLEKDIEAAKAKVDSLVAGGIAAWREKGDGAQGCSPPGSIACARFGASWVDLSSSTTSSAATEGALSLGDDDKESFWRLDNITQLS